MKIFTKSKVKRFSRTSMILQFDEDKIRDESQMIKELSHPNIIKWLDFFDEEDHMYLVMEQMQKDLMRHMLEYNDCFTEDDVRHIFCMTVDAINHCHENGIVHRDIKPGNIMVNLNSCGKVTDLKVTDFGMAFRGHQRPLPNEPENFGTHGYVAPEVYLNTYTDYQKVDCWSLGVLLFHLVTGRMPFQGELDKVMRQVADPKVKPKFNSKAWKQCDPEVKRLAKGLLLKDPNKRMDLNEVRRSKWLRERLSVNSSPSKTNNRPKYLKRKFK